MKIAIEIVDLPMKKIVIFHGYVSLPEGNGFSQPLQCAKGRKVYKLVKLDMGDISMI